MNARARCGLAILWVAALGSLSCQQLQDVRDKQALRRLFRIPRGVEIVAYSGFPWLNGFGQREGLSISATYQLTPRQLERFLRTQIPEGWEPLPVAEAVRANPLYRNLNIPLEARTGFYLCRTAGDNVLYAKRTRPCACVERLNDIILGVLDTDARRLFVVVRSRY
ncbi:MAG: hypothetical protein OEW05_14210 [Candidatus Aminicenantes bacterium]|nr:hypothetical protein [Candidatus Aminicenantes bacterium]